MVMLVETSSSGMPSNTRSMSSSESMATPTRPTSPSARGSSESIPNWVGRSNAIDSPGAPLARRYRKRALVSSAVAKPAYCRIVHGFSRYIVRYGPRVKGNSPGSPRAEARSSASTSDAW